MKIILLIGKLNPGGAERQIINLANGLSAKFHMVDLVTIFPGGELCALVNNSDYLTRVSIWKEEGKWVVIRYLQVLLTPIILRIWIKKKNPDVVYSYLELMNFIAWIATRFGFSDKLIWGLRSGKRDLAWKQSFPGGLSILVSRTVPLVISNSEAGKVHYYQIGYRPKNFISITNGVEIEYFKPDRETGILLRNQLGIKIDVFVIGIVGRINPIKDLPNFIQAAEIVSRSLDEVVFVVAGNGDEFYINELKEQVRGLKIENKVFWIGYQENMVGVYNLIDLLVSSSIVEGSPNVVLEAMACGTPCIVTDVGDSARIVDDPALVVPPGNPEALAAAIEKYLFTHHPQEYKSTLRNGIVDNYSIDRMVQRTLNAFIQYVPDLSIRS